MTNKKPTANEIAPASILNMAVFPLEQGFVVQGISVIAEQDILGDRLNRSQRRRKIYPDYKGNRRVRTRLTRHVSIGSMDDEIYEESPTPKPIYV